MKMAEPRTLLEVDGLTVVRGDVVAVDRIDFEVDAGEFFVLVGASGCGKSSLFRALAGFERPVSGSVRLGGDELVGPSSWVPPEKRRIGMVFQDGALFPHLTVLENVGYGLVGFADAQARAAEALGLVGLTDLASRYPDELSGGERQRVALARALAPEPRLLLLDEPFASLDAGLRQQVRDDVRAVVDRAGITTVLVTHDQEEALSLADRLAVMQNGRLLQIGTPSVVYEEPATLDVARFLDGDQLLACEVDRGRAACALGSVAVEADDGPAWLLVRPEQVRLVEKADAAVTGMVRDTRFFGHDLLQRIELEGGDLIEVRLAAGRAVAVGERVGLALGAGTYRVLTSDQR